MYKNINLLCQQYLHILYKKTSYNYNKASIAETSGEILYESIERLLPIMRLNENDVFVDLGSAMGKIISQIFLTTHAKTAIGIEIVPELHNTALTILQQIKNDMPHLFAQGRDIHFIHGDFLKAAFDNMTVAIINATCFPPSLLDELGEKINNTPTIRLVLSLRPLVTLRRLIFKKAIPIECSWDSTVCYCYE